MIKILVKIKKNFEFVYKYLFFLNLSKKQSRFPIKWKNRLPCMYDDTESLGFDGHYIYHPAWAARIIANIKPKKHVDISSILSFSTIVSAFVPVDFYDYRPAKLRLNNYNSNFADLLKLPFKDNSIESLSCMHTIEHVGLGRYGDDFDVNGDIKAIEELKRVVRKGGNLLIVVPVGKPMVRFNAHRIYSYGQIIEYFSGFKLKEFSLLPDSENDNGLIVNATKRQSDRQAYGCGCFWFIK